jgi:SAM-dependent methyltransferase
MDNIKKRYAETHNPYGDRNLYFNTRLFNTYNRISKLTTGKCLSGINIDLGCGDSGFSRVCNMVGIKSQGIDYPEVDFEKDDIPFKTNSVDFITMNGVIEHLSDASHILSEIKRVLKVGGLLYINTPNFQRDYLNFYNDPTHIKPYTPTSIRTILELAGFKVLFLEPALICKNNLYWKLPERIKWFIASKINCGSKSIQVVGEKIC